MAIPFSQFRPITSTTGPFSSFLLLIKLFLLISVCASLFIVNCHGFSIKEASIQDIQLTFKNNILTSRQLVQHFIQEIQTLNPILNAVIEVNPDVLSQADKADIERKMPRPSSLKPLGELHGIPILLKDNIATKDKLNTTAGSFALLNSVVPRDAGVMRKLRKAGALIMGKASLSEWSHFRGTTVPSAWCGRSKQGVNPYVILSKIPFSRGPCGSSSGSAISVAANLVTVPMCKTVSDAVYVLNSIVGFDPNDAVATSSAAKFIPKDGYSHYLKKDGLRGKRLGIVRIFFDGPLLQLFEGHIETLRQAGAVIVDNLEIDNIQTIYDPSSGEMPAMLSEFKQSLNVYLKDLVTSPVRSLADVIAFNKNNPSLEITDVYDQNTMIDAEKTRGNEAERQGALLNMQKLDNEGFKSMMIKNNLDAVVTPGNSFSTVLAIGGHPGIIVPAGYEDDGMPVGICFGGLRGSEPKLIEIAYGFEQITLIRKPPPSTTFISDV
ncbi:hypothetical protein MKW98_001074 [Papaver atlanticum]|uniref:Amidase domain-containing protein n=1 Tax=Papaver atlanticum TaxID=357466 RepID=A0AAD4SSH7_9MAGN|nr:hypothetical protein MKW98_001074 [Papaver atlanticum]